MMPNQNRPMAGQMGSYFGAHQPTSINRRQVAGADRMRQYTGPNARPTGDRSQQAVGRLREMLQARRAQLGGRVGATGPQPNARAREVANANARFMRGPQMNLTPGDASAIRPIAPTPVPSPGYLAPRHNTIDPGGAVMPAPTPSPGIRPLPPIDNGGVYLPPQMPPTPSPGLKPPPNSGTYPMQPLPVGPGVPLQPKPSPGIIPLPRQPIDTGGAVMPTTNQINPEAVARLRQLLATGGSPATLAARQF